MEEKHYGFELIELSVLKANEKILKGEFKDMGKIRIYKKELLEKLDQKLLDDLDFQRHWLQMDRQQRLVFLDDFEEEIGFEKEYYD